MTKAKAGTAVDPRARAVLLRENGVTAGTEKARLLGGWLRAVRETRGETRVVAAGKIGVAESVLSGWERGVGVPGEASLIRLRRWLGKERSNALDRIVPALGDSAKTTALARESVGLPPRNDLGPDGVSVYAAGGPGPHSVPRPGKARRARAAETVAGADEALLEALIGSSLSARSKALLSAAVVALLAGIDVEVEVRARV